MRPFVFPLIVAIVAFGCADLVGADFERQGKVGGDTSAEGGSPDAPAGTQPGADTGVPPIVEPDGAIPDDSGIAPRDASGLEAACSGCGLPKPSNAATFGTLPTAGPTATPEADATFDTSNDCAAGSILGDCTTVSQLVGPAACVCRSRALSIQNLRIRGDRALVLLVNDKVTIWGTLDVGGQADVGGPGSEPYTTSNQNGVFDYGTEDLVPLRGGEAGFPNTAKGGGGGGALQITAGTSLTITSTGRIQAGGGGGGGSEFDGAAGGSGGGVLVEAPLITVDGEILANGGGGGGGGDHDGYIGFAGKDAREAGRDPAMGGQGRDGQGCALSGTTFGGDGGQGATRTIPASAGQGPDTRGCIPTRYVGAGGNGGGVGRVRLNTGSGGASLVVGSSAHVSPQASWGVIAY